MAPRSLTDALARFSTDQLTTLLTLREDLARPLPADLGELAARAVTVASTGRAVDRLDAWQRHLVLALAAAADGVGVDGLFDLLAAGTPRESVVATVQELRLQALVWGEDGELHVVRTVREVLGPFPAGLAPVSLRPLTAAAVRTALEQVGPPEQVILDRLLWRQPTGALRQADREVSLQAARNPVERLLALGLLRPADADTVLLPREVAWELREQRLTPTTPPTEPPALTSGTRPPGVVTPAAVGAAWALVHDVEQLVDDLATRPCTVLRDGGVPAREVAARGRRVALQPTQAAMLLEWAGAAGLVATEGPRLLPTPGYDRWTTAGGAQRWVQLVRAWAASPRWPMAAARPGAHPLAGDLGVRGAAEIRHGLLTVLAGQPVGQRVDAAELAAAVGWHHPVWAERLPLEELVGELLVEVEQAGLTALGAVSPLARTALGADLDEAVTALFPEPIGHLVVQADLTAVAPGPLRAEVAHDLRLLAEQESRGGGGVYRFTERSLRRAFDAGWSPAEVEAWLAEHSSTGVPQPLGYLLGDVARQHGSIRVTPVLAVVRCDDPAQAASLLQRPEARALGLQQLAPGLLAASVEPDEVVRALQAVGLAPVATDASGATLTAPPPPRAREVERAGSEGEPADPGLAAELLLGREQDRRARAESVDSAVDVLRRAAATGTEVVLDWVTSAGESTTSRATPLTVTSGAVRLESSGQVLSVPLARVLAARPRTAPRR